NGAAVPALSWSDTSVTIVIPAGATSGPLVVSVAPSMNDSNAAFLEVTSQPLPVSWMDQDIGSFGVGSATYSSGVFTIKGSGGTYWTASDSLHFMYQQISGDGSIVARVANVQNSGSVQVGVMIRETLDPGSSDAYVSFRPNQAAMYYRSTAGASASSQWTSFIGPQYPYWVKLTRSGNAFSGYISSDGISWTQVGTSQTIAMAQNVYIGLAVAGASVTASFDNVSINSAANPAPMISSLSATTGSTGSQVVITGSHFGTTQGNSAVFLSDAPMAVNAWNDTSVTITIASGALSGDLVVSVAPPMNASNPEFFSVTTQPLPPGWLDQDIGETGGTATYSSGTFTANTPASGGSLWSTSDGFHFVYQPLSGDGTIVARVANVQNNLSVQAGVMIRETLDPASKDAYVSFWPNQAVMDYRSTAGASASSQWTSFIGPQYPYWVK